MSVLFACVDCFESNNSNQRLTTIPLICSMPKNRNRFGSVVLLLLLLSAWLIVRTCGSGIRRSVRNENQTEQTGRGLNRHPAAINYSKHAKCRMQCRHISQSEVEDILHNGSINYGKSEIGDNPDCSRKYAVEGTTNDGQRVRIIFAPCASEVTVVTVIDLGQEWQCDCE